VSQTKSEKMLELAQFIVGLRQQRDQIQTRIYEEEERFRRLAGDDVPPVESAAAGTLKDRVRAFVDATNGPVRPIEVAEHFPETTRESVSTTMSELAARRKIKKVSHGVYAPNGWVAK